MYFQVVEDRNEEICPFLASVIIELKNKTIMSNWIANEIYEETFDKEKQAMEWWKIEKKKAEIIEKMSRQWSKTSDLYIQQLQSDFEDLEE